MKILHALLLITTQFTIANNIELTVSGAQQTMMPIAIMILDADNNELNTIAQTIAQDLQFTEQFKVCIKKYPSIITTAQLGKEIKQLAYANIPLALCISAKTSKHIEWRLYDTIQCEMLQGKKYKKNGPAIHRWAHAIADAVWKKLTNSTGFFSSRLAYCKNVETADGNNTRKVYIADFNGTNEELLVDSGTIIVAPRWNNKKQQLFYSEYTDTNVRLMYSDMQKNIHNASHFDQGIEMLINFAPNGEDYVYCASRGNGSSQIYLYKDGKLRRCTKNSGNNTSPIFLDEEHICFSSDFQTGYPQIYIGNIKTGHLQRISKGGYCTSPTFCPETNKIAYHKMVQGVMQIIIYDRATKTYTQLTYDGGSKHESSWSPGGAYLLFAHETGCNQSKLALLNIITGKRTYISSWKEYCCYPHWSN